MNIELIYDEDCPNFEAARIVLKRALEDLDLSMDWHEWNLSSSQVPSFICHFGSPTILVNGRDVAGATPEVGVHCCRLYEDAAGSLQKVPPVELVVQAIREALYRK